MKSQKTLSPCQLQPYIASMRNHLMSYLSHALKLAFSVGLIFWLVRSGRLEFSSLTKLLEPMLVFAGVFTAGFSIVLTTQRWRFFLRSQKLPIPFSSAFQLNLIGIFFNYAVPGGVGGDLVKGYYITKSSPHAKMSAALTVFVDRLIGLFSMLSLALGIMIWRWDIVGPQKELVIIFQALSLLMAAFCVLWALMFSRRLYSLNLIGRILAKLPKGQLLVKTYESLMLYRHHKSTFITTFFISLIAQGVAVLFFYSAGQGLGFTSVPGSVYFFVIPVAFMIQSLPLSFGGIGIGQAASFFLFNLAMPGSGAVGSATTTAFQIVNFLFGLLGAYFYLGISKKIKTANLTSPQPEVPQ